MKEMIEFVARSLVDKPDEVRVTELAGEQTLMYELRVAEPDLGKVIGRSGRTARALRTLLSAAAARQGRKAVLEILD